MTTGVRTVDWDGDAVLLIDQTLLPERLEVRRVRSVAELCEDIARLAVRGAPALGVAGALGMALAAVHGEDVDEAARRLGSARPTAVNLGWGVRRVQSRRHEGVEAMVAEALRVLEDEVSLERALAVRGADLLDALHPAPHRVLTHCNTGGLAGVETGTALGAVAEAHRRGHLAEVLATETRPLLQGARLTAWELGRLGMPHRLLVDGAAAWAMQRGLVDVVVVGADRIAANGDVANKIGTLAHAVAARHAGVPFVVVAPESTVDPAAATGDDIPIEERPAGEVTGWSGRRVAPDGTGVFNPAFDVTPAALVTAVVTERRVFRPAEGVRAVEVQASP